MKFLFDLLPVILFFAAYKLAGAHEAEAHALISSWLGDGIAPSQAPILLSTIVAIAATAGQIAWVWLRHRKVDTMLWVSLGLITVFGGATLIFHNPTFIKWKPTALYWLFAAVLGISAWVLKHNLLRRMLQGQVALPEAAWSKLNTAWVLFFAAMGGLNLFVAYQFSESAWVNFKLFGGMGLMLAFVLAQGFYLSRYLEEDKA